MDFGQWSEFSPKQLESIEKSVSRLNIWHGAIRSGKTIASLIRWLIYLRIHPSKSGFLMVGKTERTLKRNILDVLEQTLSKKEYSLNQGEGVATIFNKKIYLAGANDIRSEEKIRGLTLCGTYGDEVTLWPQNFFVTLLGRNSIKGSQLFLTTNPDSPFHYLKTDYIDKQDILDLSEFHFELTDNYSLDKNYILSLKQEFTGLFYKRFIEGLWVLAEGAIFENFDEDKHVIDVKAFINKERLELQGDFNKTYKRYIGIDYGTSNPCVFIDLYYNTKTKKSYIYQEYFHSGRETKQRTDLEYTEDLIEFIGKEKCPVAIDPSAASFKTQLEQKGIPITSADNKVLDGIRYVSKRLTNNQLYVDKSCTNLRKEFSSYSWDPKAQLRGEDKPLKVFDHGLDATRYIISTFIETVPSGVLYGFNFA